MHFNGLFQLLFTLNGLARSNCYAKVWKVWNESFYFGKFSCDLWGRSYRVRKWESECMATLAWQVKTASFALLCCGDNHSPNTALLSNFTMHSAYCLARPGSLVRKPCPVALPGSLVRQSCRNITSLLTGRRPACSIAYFYRPNAGCLVQAFPPQF
jgi:hypothetical protein